MIKKYVALVLTMCLILAGCDQDVQEEPTVTSPPIIGGNAEDYFSDRDYKTAFEAQECTKIELNGDKAASDGAGVTFTDGCITITEEGEYILTGSLDGMIIVDVDKKDKVRLILNDAYITSDTSAALYIRQADKVFVTTVKGTENILSSGDMYVCIDENDIDAAVFSKEDLTLNGEGVLTIISPVGHGIVSKDELTITSGTYRITSASHGLSGKDSVCITGAMLEITSGKDCIQSDNTEDAEAGFVYIDSGNFKLSAEGDAVSASGTMQILGGDFEVVCGGGYVKAEQKTSQNWGGFMGGGPRGPGDRGGNTTQNEADSTSIKGFKSEKDMILSGGNFVIDSADDALHSNGNISVYGGTFTVSSGDDAFHADNTLQINAGTISIENSYEGLEAQNVLISGGTIELKATDDGINAAGGADESGYGGFRGGDRFGGGMGSSKGKISISGGTLYINASGDGVDANGCLEISGGNITLCGPTRGDTAVLDYDTTGVINGGRFLGTGSSMMAQTFSSSENQGVIALNVGNQKAGTQIRITASDGKLLLQAEPKEDFAIVIFSCPELVKGDTYTVTVGSQSGTFEAA